MKTRKFFKVYGAVDPVRERARTAKRAPGIRFIMPRPKRIGGIPILRDGRLEIVDPRERPFDLEKPGQYSEYWQAGAKAAKEKAPGT